MAFSRGKDHDTSPQKNLSSKYENQLLLVKNFSIGNTTTSHFGGENAQSKSSPTLSLTWNPKHKLLGPIDPSN